MKKLKIICLLTLIGLTSKVFAITHTISIGGMPGTIECAIGDILKFTNSGGGGTFSVTVTTGLSATAFSSSDVNYTVTGSESSYLVSFSMGGSISGSIIVGTDADADGYVSVGTGGTDCDDASASSHPGAPEIFDGKDNNCNGAIDEGFWIWTGNSSGDYHTLSNTVNVGIGTSTPAYKLDVAGTGRYTSNLKIGAYTLPAIDGTSGQALSTDGAGGVSWQTIGGGAAWSLIGNAGTSPSTNFIGTTDNNALVFKVNSQKAGKIDPLGAVFFGYQAGNGNTVNNVTGVGYQALYSNTGGGNTAVGNSALYSNTTGTLNVATGYNALNHNTAGTNNVAIGSNALINTGGSNNTGTGTGVLTSNTTGTGNTATGYAALYYNTTGTYNTAVGYNAFYNGASYSNSTGIGANSLAISANDMVRVGSSAVTSIGGQVGWTTVSDARVKMNVKENVQGLEFITKLRPVTYFYDIDKENELLGSTQDANSWEGKEDIKKMQFSGFLAQEVDAAAQKAGYNFSGVDKSGALWGLRYSDFVVPLVKAVQEQQQMIDSLKANDAKQAAAIKSLQDQINKLVTTGTSTPAIGASGNTGTNVSLSDKNTIVLEQNVPNPFAEQTTISYFLPDNVQHAEMIFYEQGGRAIKTVQLTEKGHGSLNVFASDLSNGIYSYSLIVDGQTVETKKMMRTK